MSKSKQRKLSNRQALQKAYEAGYSCRMRAETVQYVYTDKRMFNQFYLGWKHAGKKLADFQSLVDNA